MLLLDYVALLITNKYAKLRVFQESIENKISVNLIKFILDDN